MITLTNKPKAAFHREGRIHVVLESDLELVFPVAGNPRLAGKGHDALNRIELSPYGLHWPELDEDLSLEGILAGRYAYKAVRGAPIP